MNAGDLSITELAIATAQGGGFALGFVFLRWFLTFAAGRFDRREASLDAATQRLIGQLQEQIETLLKRLDQVEKDLADCKRQHAESEHDRAQLRGLLQAKGDEKQEAQRIIALEKLTRDEDEK